MAAPLLALKDAAVRLGSEVLFQDLTVALARGDRVCLVGRNGSGKSTLLRALAGEIELDAGDRFQGPGTTVAYLPQEPGLPPGRSVLEVVLDGLSPDRAGAEHLGLAMAGRFGLDPARPLAGLSGGELRRVALAQTLIADPDVLLLDEPTNHLDIAAIEGLEEELGAFRGGLVVVSHDRAFLRALARTTWWLDRGRVRVLDEGFAAFDAWSERLLAEEEAEQARLAKTIAAETFWSHHGITARRKRNQGRLRRLEALRRERAEHLAPEGRVRLEAAATGRGSRLIVEAEGIARRFGEEPLIEDFSTRILRGDRIGIVGPNGCGKTTLIRLLTGRLAPDRGRVRLAENLAIAYVDQRREQLDPDATPWSTLCPGGGDQVEVQGRPRHVMSYLQDFLFRPQQARSPIRSLSGGERNRLLLARQLARPCDLMVLDEPTNDLDMDTLDLLQEVLAEFAGTLLLVSHDRDFLDRLVTGVIVFEGGGRLVEYAGGWSDMLRQRGAAPGRARSPAAAKAKPRREPAPKPAPQAGPARPRRPERELERTLARVEALESEIRALEAALADPDLFLDDPDGFRERTRQLEARRAELAGAEARWQELEEMLEPER